MRRIRTRVLTLVALVLASTAIARSSDLLEEALECAKPLSELHFQASESYFLPGKGRGIPEEEAEGLGIALQFAQNNYWWSDFWSAARYPVRTGTLVDPQGRLDPVKAWEISSPEFSEDFQFVASGNDLFFHFPVVDDYTVYSFSQSGLAANSAPVDLVYRFGNGDVAREAEIARSEVIPGGFTKVPGINLHDRKQARVYFWLPKSVRLRSATIVADGVAAARVSHTSLGRATLLSIDVSNVGVPETSFVDDTKPGDAYGAKSGLVSFPNEDGGISILWQEAGTQELFITKVSSDLSHESVQMPRSLGLFGDCTRDESGDYYYITHETNNYYITPEACNDPNVYLVKANSNGAELKARRLEVDPSELDIKSMSGPWDSVHMLYVSGQICVVFARAMHCDHQGSIVVTYRSSDLAQVRNYGQNSGHSFDSRITHDGIGFLTMSLGDNYPRGIVLDKIFDTYKQGRIIYTYKTHHDLDGNSSNDNRTYTQLGDLVPGPNGYGVLFSSEAGTDNSEATSAINEARNLAYILVAPDFNRISQQEHIVPRGMILTNGSDSPLFGFYNAGGEYVQQQYRGVCWLTSYTDKDAENATRPKMVALQDSRRLVLWEKWTRNHHVSTHGLVVTPFGDIELGPVDMGTMRLSDGDRPAVKESRIHSVTANGRELEWTILETDLPENPDSGI